MSTTYGIERNIIASTVDYIEAQLIAASLSNVTVNKGFARIYEIALPKVSIRISDTEHEKVEIGSNSTKRIPLVLVDIFAEDDDQRADIKDVLIASLKHGYNYYEYIINNGEIQSKTLNGRIKTEIISDVAVNLNVEKHLLSESDKYRHLISLDVSLGKVEL